LSSCFLLFLYFLYYCFDLFSALPAQKYDLIVSNPPYVAIAEWEQLPAEFHAEPEMGFTGGESGLDLVIKILVDCFRKTTSRPTNIIPYRH
jgi:ribosomal protein L3 glutamine methyltransferase